MTAVNQLAACSRVVESRVCPPCVARTACRSSFAKTRVLEFASYKPRYLCCRTQRREITHVNKLLTVCALAAVAVLFSRAYIPQWIHMPWASPGNLCLDSESKLSVFREEV